MTQTILQDLRHALRSLRSSPGFTLVAVLTLALGIGANTVVFSVAKGVLLRSTGVSDPERVVWVRPVNPALGNDAEQVSWRDYLDIGESVAGFESLALFAAPGAIWDHGDRLEERPALVTTPSLAEVLGIRAVLGRMLSDADAEPSAEPVALISYELWQARFGGKADVIGKTVPLGPTRTIVGVLPPGLEFPAGRAPASGSGSGFEPGAKDFWFPLKVEGPDRVKRENRMFAAVGRLRPGASDAAVRSELALMSQRLAAEFPGSNRGWQFVAISLRDQILGPTRRGLFVLAGAVAAVLLVCCVNLANLLLARGAARRHELAVRAALGAGRGRIARGVLAEAAVLSLAGGCAGAFFAAWAVPAVRAAAPAEVPFIREVTVDGAVLAFTLALSLLTALVFGLIPALRQSRVGAAEALRSGARASAGHDVRAWQRSLLAGQVALVLVLLASAGLLLESFRKLTGQDLGYTSRSVVAADITTLGFPTNGDVCRFYRRMHARLSTLPGVEAVGTVSSAPLTGKWTFNETAQVLGQSLAEAERPKLAATFVAFDYFQAMGVPLVDGRFFRDAELKDDGYGQIVIVNESAAALLFPGRSAVGGRFTVGSNPDRVLEIVGVVKDTRDVRLEEAPRPRFYWQYAFGGAQLVVRGTLSVDDMAAMLRDELSRAGPGIIVRGVRPMDEVVAAAVAERQFLMAMLSAYAAVALAVAAVGVFGVVAYQVSHRTREFGVRLAFGASPAALARLVLTEAGAVVAVGIGAGLLLTLASSRVLAAHLFELSPYDPRVIVAVSGLVLAAGLVASLLPARRAARVEPMEALRHE